MTTAMIWRCFDSRNIRSASSPPTPFSSPAASRPLRSTPRARETIAITTRHAAGKHDGADEQELPAAELLDEKGWQTAADEPAKTGTCADEAEQPFRLASIKNDVGQRPELGNEEDRVDLAEPVQCRGDPPLHRRSSRLSRRSFPYRSSDPRRAPRRASAVRP